MTLVVRDEADILEFQLAYHRAQGVDHFLVLDHRSVDESLQILQQAEAAGWLHYYQESSLLRHQGQWVTALARKAYLEHQADWVINNDADEFWWSDRGTLKQVFEQIPTDFRLAQARRHNFICDAEWAQQTGKKQPFWQALTRRQQASHNFLGEALSGKLCHRGEAEILVHHGNHSVAPMSEQDFWPDSDFEVFHYPVRNFAQFERKVRNGGASWVANPQLHPSIGRGKRHLYGQYLRGELRETFQQWSLHRVAQSHALEQGELCIDTRLRDWCLAQGNF